VTTTFQTIVRRSAAVLVAAVAFLTLAGPAQADVPVGWAAPYHVDRLHTVLVFVGIPVLMFVVIAVLVYIPSLIRGERMTPGAPAVEDHWFGGPRKGTSELPGPDTEESKAGGASGRW